MGKVRVAAGSERVGRRVQLAEEAANYVRALIMSGELPPGASVQVDSIAEALDISTTPTREALQALRVEGFLDLIPRHGFRVAAITGKDIQDLFCVQALVAGELTARATTNATQAELDRLKSIHEQLVAAANDDDLERVEELNHSFHSEMYRIACAPKILWVLGLLVRYVPRRFYATIPGWPESSREDHGSILELVYSGRAEEARLAMHAHIAHSGELLAAHFDERLR